MAPSRNPLSHMILSNDEEQQIERAENKELFDKINNNAEYRMSYNPSRQVIPIVPKRIKLKHDEPKKDRRGQTSEAGKRIAANVLKIDLLKL